MRVWIDDDLCTGDALCEEIAPAVFKMLDDGLAYVVEDGQVMGACRVAIVPVELEQVVIEASDECPGSCIFIEEDDRAPYAAPESSKLHQEATTLPGGYDAPEGPHGGSESIVDG